MELSFERGGLAQVGAVFSGRRCTRVLIVCTPSRRFVDAALASLAASGVDAEIFDGARVHVPGVVVAQAREAFDRHGDDGLLALGGGSATGLGKALRLEREFFFAALPTTYSGSELTAIWGVTEAGDKRTGRDPRVRPDRVIYDAELLAGLPAALAVQSALNAMAHPVSALSTGGLVGEVEQTAIHVAATLFDAVQRIASAPDDVDARERAMRGAAEAAQVLDGATLGVHHKLAHLLGGRFGLEHAALHSALLPGTVAGVLAQPGLGARLGKALGRDGADGVLRDVLHAVGAPATLTALGVARSAALEALEGRPELASARAQLEACFS